MSAQELLTTSLAKLQLVALLQAGTCALLIYDYVLTFDAEVDLMFPSAWNVGKVLYFLTRYVPFMPQAMAFYLFIQNAQVSYTAEPLMSQETCVKMYAIYSYMIMGGIMISELILSVRVYALWARNKIVAALLISAGTAGIIVTVVKFSAAASESSTADPRPTPENGVPHIHGCFPIQISTDRERLGASFVCFIALVAYESLIFSMTMIRAIQEWRTRGTGGASQLIISFYRDGITYFLFALSTSLLNVALNAPSSVPLEYTNLMLPLQHALHSIISGRMVLHLRRQVQKEVFASTINGSEVGGMQFARVAPTETVYSSA